MSPLRSEHLPGSPSSLLRPGISLQSLVRRPLLRRNKPFRKYPGPVPVPLTLPSLPLRALSQGEEGRREETGNVSDMSAEFLWAEGGQNGTELWHVDITWFGSCWDEDAMGCCSCHWPCFQGPQKPGWTGGTHRHSLSSESLQGGQGLWGHRGPGRAS